MTVEQYKRELKEIERRRTRLWQLAVSKERREDEAREAARKAAACVKYERPPRLSEGVGRQWLRQVHPLR